MKSYSVSALRRSLARVLDEVERGDPVAVERRGKRFHIVPAPPAGRPDRRPKPLFIFSDPSLDHGWSWEWRGPGKPLRLRSRRRRAAPR